MSRSILFDTETTGLDPSRGDRVIEIAALELQRDLPTGRYFHALIDPECPVPEEATRIHGLSSRDLAGKPRFAEIVDSLLEFLGEDPMIAHNAAFDFGFLDAELVRVGRPALDRARMVCTLEMAKLRFPGLPNSLDALCRRFAIDLSARTTHNALLDCRLLADVFVELTGGRQRGLLLVGDGADGSANGALAAAYPAVTERTPWRMEPSEAELAAHAAFIARLAQPVWARL